MTEITWTTDEYGTKRGTVGGWEITYWPLYSRDSEEVRLNPHPDVTGPSGEDVSVDPETGTLDVHPGESDGYYTSVPFAIIKELLK